MPDRVTIKIANNRKKITSDMLGMSDQELREDSCQDHSNNLAAALIRFTTTQMFKFLT